MLFTRELCSKLARCAMLAMEEHGKKGREGLFFNHHQLGLATKEVTRLAAVVVWQRCVVAFHLLSFMVPPPFGTQTRCVESKSDLFSKVDSVLVWRALLLVQDVKNLFCVTYICH